MNNRLYGASPLWRALVEHRVVVLTLVALLVANLLAFAIVVAPLSRRVAGVEDRNRAAAQELAAARQEQTRAADALGSRAQAVDRLSTFYDSILPTNLVQARRLADPRLWQLGERIGLQVGNATYDEEETDEGRLTRLRMAMELTGSYADVRSFIRQIEEAPEFLVIDGVMLQEDNRESGVLQVRLEASTYYRNAAP